MTLNVYLASSIDWIKEVICCWKWKNKTFSSKTIMIPKKSNSPMNCRWKTSLVKSTKKKRKASMSLKLTATCFQIKSPVTRKSTEAMEMAKMILTSEKNGPKLLPREKPLLMNMTGRKKKDGLQRRPVPQRSWLRSRKSRLFSKKAVITTNLSHIVSFQTWMRSCWRTKTVQVRTLNLNCKKFIQKSKKSSQKTFLICSEHHTVFHLYIFHL